MSSEPSLPTSRGVPPALKSVLPFLIALPLLALAHVVFQDWQYSVYLSSLVGVNIILAVSLNIVNGMTGQFSIGHAGFMAVGAYVAARFSLSVEDVAIAGVPHGISDQLLLLIALAIGGTAAAICGFIVGLPSLRLRGDYLAIVTLGFGEIIRVVVQNTEMFGRALGLSGTPQWSNLFMIGFCVFLTVLVAQRIAGSAHGRSLFAIREDEVAAEAMGVDTTGYKVRAFVISSFFAGVAGALFAHFVPIINPGSFTFVKSMEIVVMIVLGGLGSISGAIVAAIVLTLLPEALRTVFMQLAPDGDLAQKVDQIRMPVYGILLVVLMLVRPQGLFGTKEIWEFRFRRWVTRAKRPA